jgi:preprotein translocase subunit SecF
VFRFSRGFIVCSLLSLAVIALGIAGYALKGGFNLGIDFRAGLIQEVQLVPRAFSLSYDGPGNAVISHTNANLTIAVSGAGVQGITYQYAMADYGTMGAFVQALDQAEGITVVSAVPPSTPFRLLVLDAQAAPVLPSASNGGEPYWVHYLPVNAPAVPLEEVRRALSSLGDPAVQVLGENSERRFMIRLQDSDMKEGFEAADIQATLEKQFGEGEAAVTSSNYVGSRFSKNLADQAAWLLAATLALILIYASIRFKPQYAIGAVLAIMHDALIMVTFIVWTQMEFNTTTIAAILTILGYSINDTIVIFDRIRETRRIYPGDDFEVILNRSITETLGRTFITTITTMLAVLSLYIFTTGSMKDFAQALLVGLVSGVYSTIFIACGFVYLWERKLKKNAAEPEAKTVEAKA